MKKIKNLSGNSIIIALFAVLVVIGVVNVLILTNAALMAGQKTTQQNAAAQPAMLELVVVENGCSNCYSYSQFVEGLKTENVNVTQRSVSSSSGEGAALVAKYNIANFPSLVITGELNKTQQLASLWLQIGTLRADAVIIAPQPPYYSVAQDRVVGLVNITRITDTSCVNCASIGDVIDSFRGYGAVFSRDI